MSAGGTAGPNIHQNVPKPLGSTSAPLYRAIPEVSRLFAEGCRYHVAVHEVSAEDGVSEDYCRPHVHPNFDEVNILVGAEGALVVHVEIDGESAIVESPATIVFPAGVSHVAQVRRGRGTLVIIHMTERTNEQPAELRD